MVTMYKLAEQIIGEEKKFRIPSYYGIFKEKAIEFSEVIVDDKYDRIDKQPDVIATTADGVQYLIEFTFANKVQHRASLDYRSLNCVVVDLSSQTFESLRDFLLNSSEGRQWLNNQMYFEQIEAIYADDGRLVKVVSEIDCEMCSLKNSCCGIRQKEDSSLIFIENNGFSYRVCKVNEYNERKKEQELRQAENQIPLVEQTSCSIYERHESAKGEIEVPEMRTCFMCVRNRAQMVDDGYGHCSIYEVMGVPMNTPPDTAQTCRGFRCKI